MGRTGVLWVWSVCVSGMRSYRFEVCVCMYGLVKAARQDREGAWCKWGWEKVALSVCGSLALLLPNQQVITE